MLRSAIACVRPLSGSMNIAHAADFIVIMNTGTSIRPIRGMWLQLKGIDSSALCQAVHPILRLVVSSATRCIWHVFRILNRVFQQPGLGKHTADDSFLISAIACGLLQSSQTLIRH